MDKRLLISFSLLILASCNSNSNNKPSINQKVPCDTVGLTYGKVRIGLGLICNGKKSGTWKEWDTAGNFLWKGEYNNGQRCYTDSFAKILAGSFRFINNEDVLQCNKGYTILVTINREDIHPMDLRFYSKGGDLLTESEFKYSDNLMICRYIKKDGLQYYYEFTPLKSGDMPLMLLFARYNNGHYSDYLLSKKTIKVIR